MLKLWNEILDDMYGEDTERKKALYEVALKDERISQKAKAWLNTISAL